MNAHGAGTPNRPKESAWPSADGEMAARIRAHDWAATPLGPIEAWPQSLKTAVDLLLPSGFPMVVLWGPELTQIYNDGCRALMGDRHPAVLGQPVRECWPEVWHIIEPICRRVRAGETLTFEDALCPVARHGAPEDAWFTLSYSPVRDEAGAVAGVLVTAFETTARHLSERRHAEAELALREGEERYRALVTATSYAVYRMSPDWAEMRRLDGRGFLADTGEPSGTWLDEYIHPDDQAHVLAAIREAIRTKGVFELEHRVRRADGTLGWTLSRAVPLLDARGEVREWFGAASDVTERRRTEEALRESEGRLAADLAGMRRLHELHAKLAAESDLDAALGEILAMAVGLLQTDRGCVQLVSDDGERLELAATHGHGPGSAFIGHLMHEGSKPACDMARRQRQRMVIEDVAAFPALAGTRDREVALAEGIRATCRTPLISRKGETVGVLCAQFRQPHRPSDHQLRLVDMLAWTAADFVERHKAEAALRASEGLFRGFAENSTDVLWIADAGGRRLEYLSPAFDRVFGEPRDRVMAGLGRWRELVHPEDREAASAFLPRALAGEVAIAHYRVVRPADGRVVHLRDTGFPIRDAAGAVARVAGIVQDVTDIVLATGALEAEKERLRALAEGIPQLVWRSAEAGEWTWAGPQWEAFTGLSAEASLGRGWLEALHPDDRAGALAAWAAAGTGGMFQADYRVRHAASERHVWFQTRGVPVRCERGESVEWLGASTDIDAQVRAREVLARGREELEALVGARTAELMAAEETVRQSQKMEAVGQLTGGIAHDFNNMLQGVMGGIEMARRRMGAGRPEEARRYLDAAREAATRAAGLTRRLLAFARRQRLDPKPVDPNGLVAGLADLVRRTVVPAVALELKLCDGAGIVLCDANELESAVLNLCINARDAMPEGGRLTVCTEYLRLSAADVAGHEGATPGDYVAVRVTDTGQGMPPEVLERVFEPFFTTKPLGQGTGLGLSQVYGFARQSGGLVQIESAPGRGTTVRILLPRHERATVAAAAAERAPPPATPAREGAAGGAATVLLVDDEGAARAPTAERLREMGHRVLEATDGQAALRLLADGARIDLLITDVGLPGGMNGRQVAEAARERWPGLPVLFITGYAGGRLPPGSEVIGKPFGLDTLAQRVHALLAARPGDWGGALDPRAACGGEPRSRSVPHGLIG